MPTIIAVMTIERIRSRVTNALVPLFNVGLNAGDVDYAFVFRLPLKSNGGSRRIKSLFKVCGPFALSEKTNSTSCRNWTLLFVMLSSGSSVDRINR